MRCGAADTLTAESLSVAGPGGPIVRNVSFRLRRGGATCLVGETGVGKSLVAQALLGLLPPGLRAEGCLILPGGRRFDLSDPARLHPLWGRELFLLPQEPREALDPTARMLGQVAEALPAPDRAGVAAGLLARFGIGRRAARSVPAALSGGMAQRGLMAIASAVPAPILVVDEPTKGLDPQRLAEVVDALGTMCAEGRSLLVVTHDLGLCLALEGDILVLHGGEVVESGLAKTVLSDPRHRWTRELAAAQPTNWPARARTPCSAAPVLGATRVSFAWPGGKTLFRDISLRACPGRIIGIAGASGVGKSTLCDILTGLRRPAEGSVSWGGKDPGTMNRTDRVAGQRRFQKLHQDPGASFPPHRRLRSIFADLAAVTEAPLQRLAALMERLRLRPDTLDRRVGEISGGEAQRLALARALLLRPSVLVADEPTSRLDAITQAEISRLLREAADRDGLAIVWVSHDASLLRALADDVLHLC